MATKQGPREPKRPPPPAEPRRVVAKPIPPLTPEQWRAMRDSVVASLLRERSSMVAGEVGPAQPKKTKVDEQQ
jgi:hypothetical protein